jgi:predicted component of type VI protein secretion system
MSKTKSAAFQRKVIETRICVENMITECSTLAEVQQRVAELISQYGSAANIRFDSGYSNIDEEIVLTREENDSEFNARIDEEIESLIRKQKKHSSNAATIEDSIENLKNMKV